MTTIEQVFLDTKAIFEKQAAEAMEAVMSKIYSEYLPHIENDNYFNVRTQCRDWLERFMNDSLREDDISIKSVTEFYSGKDIRAKMFQDNKEELTKIIGKDIVERVYELEQRVAQHWEKRYG
jgi:hypothetical protein